MHVSVGETSVASVGRIPALDLARSVAILGMVAFHLVYDLSLFGFLPSETPFTPFWANLARLVAGSFLFLVGVSLFLAHSDGIRWQSFLRRLAIIVLCAGAVTGATFVLFPDRFVFFGILHSIAVSSVLGLAFLRMPVWGLVLAALAVMALPHVARAEVFAHPALLWTGLAPWPPSTMDYEPVFPWFGPCLLGIAFARALKDRGSIDGMRRAGERGGWMKMLVMPGRHSLLIYMIHQPILIGIIWVIRTVLP